MRHQQSRPTCCRQNVPPGQVCTLCFDHDLLRCFPRRLFQANSRSCSLADRSWVFSPPVTTPAGSARPRRALKLEQQVLQILATSVSIGYASLFSLTDSTKQPFKHSPTFCLTFQLHGTWFPHGEICPSVRRFEEVTFIPGNRY